MGHTSIAPFHKVDVLSTKVCLPANFITIVQNYCSHALSSGSEKLSLAPTSDIVCYLDDIDTLCNIIRGCKMYPFGTLHIPANILTDLLVMELAEEDKDIVMIQCLTALIRECK